MTKRRTALAAVWCLVGVLAWAAGTEAQRQGFRVFATDASGNSAAVGVTGGALHVSLSGASVPSVMPTDDRTLVGNGSVWQAKALSDCDAATSAVTYDVTTNAFGCNSISGGTSLTDSASLRTALSDETGSGAAVFAGGNIGAATATSLTSAAGADGCFGWVCRKTVTLTDAQIKALPSTAVELLPAPGAGKANLPLDGFMVVNTSAGAYTNVSYLTDGGITAMYFTSSAYGLPAVDPLTTGLNGFTKSIRLAAANVRTYLAGDTEVTLGIAQAGTPKSGTSGANAGVMDENTALTVLIDNYDSDYSVDRGNFTGGNAANTLKIVMFYSVVDVP